MSTKPRVCLIGPSTRFLSGVSYHTYALAGSLAPRVDLSVLLLRRLLPQRWYPGASRVGDALTEVELTAGVPVCDGVDWFWGTTLADAARFLRRQRPDVVIFQWWTGAVLHTYRALATIARRQGCRIVVEFHETQDPGEAERGWVAEYVDRVSPSFFRRASAHIVHSDSDVHALEDRFGIPSSRTVVIPFAGWDHYIGRGQSTRVAPAGVCNLLFFGLIRPVKGLEDLIRAFDALSREAAARYWLTVVGETWEDHTLPFELVAASRHRDRITVVNRYVTDAEADSHFSGADVVVLPYRKAAQSAVLHVAMGYGLPVVVTDVGGLADAVRAYPGAVVARAGDPSALRAALDQAASLAGTRFTAPHDWEGVADRHVDVIDRVLGTEPVDVLDLVALEESERQRAGA